MGSVHPEEPPRQSRRNPAPGGHGHAQDPRAHGEDLVIDTGVTHYASRNAANYQVSGKAACGTIATTEGGCKPFITVNGANAGIMGTKSSSGSQGLSDGRGDLDIYGQSQTWWGLASAAQTTGEDQNNPRLIQSNGVNNFTVYDLSLTNSPNFHLVFNAGSGFTVWVRIKTPANARNTDGIDPSGTDVTINNSYISDGDDRVAMKAGSSAAMNMTIENSHFYGAHGISISSETNAGVSNILFYATGNGTAIPDHTNIVVDGARAVSSASGATSVLEG